MGVFSRSPVRALRASFTALSQCLGVTVGTRVATLGYRATASVQLSEAQSIKAKSPLYERVS